MPRTLKTRAWLIRKDDIRQQYHTTPKRLRARGFVWNRRLHAWVRPRGRLLLSWQERLTDESEGRFYRFRVAVIDIPEENLDEAVEDFLTQDGQEITPGWVAFNLDHELLSNGD